MMPPVVQSNDAQLALAVAQMNRYEKDIDKFVYLNGLRVSIFRNLLQNKYNKSSIS